MQLKEIKPGMAIHCKDEAEKIALLEEADRLGYKWSNDCVATNCRMIKGPGMTIHFYEPNVAWNFNHITWSDKTEGVTEFADLILTELTAEEVWEWLSSVEDGEICDYFKSCEWETREKLILGAEWKDLVAIVEKHIADHEKKEPEIETVDICRIIEIQPDGRNRCVHEEDIKHDPELPYGSEEIAVHEILKRYCMEHDGEFIAVHEVVSRVKAVE